MNVSSVSSESDPAWCIGPILSTLITSAILFRPPWRPLQNLHMYFMSKTLGKNTLKISKKSLSVSGRGLQVKTFIK
eukprot:CAMPEP_0197505792 /NCGR_PEP_ID=MMETSP1312-20131121/4424_1 /TAXON_ID=464262 /ORGANISM="Genus nov. species nov., Strain RCC2335" /LENGTH=75 /DNA_ID=CAMNT_0043052773 /DNA_START=244 /DNA_END=471 /DNA_ORIENTATION=+